MGYPPLFTGNKLQQVSNNQILKTSHPLRVVLQASHVNLDALPAER